MNVGEGKWTILEIVGHIMLWDKYFLEESIEKIFNKSILTVQHLNFDEFNSKAKIHVKTISISELSDEEYLKTYIDGDGNPFYVTQYLKDFIWHDQHHINQMKNMLGREDIKVTDLNLLRHFLATLNYRFTKAIKNTPKNYPTFSIGSGVRSPIEILSHMSFVLCCAQSVFKDFEPKEEEIGTWEDELNRFYRTLNCTIQLNEF
jgi:hypothetical protein